MQSGDRYAVRAMAIDGDPNRMQPVQVSVYSKTELIGSIALNDVGAYAKSEDPWYQRDPFESSLLPAQVNLEDQPRLLDAIYVTALRNRLPTPVVGETIMLLSRAQDLEQKVQTGDTITIIYSPLARDFETGPWAHRLCEHRPHHGQSGLLCDAITAGCAIRMRVIRRTRQRPRWRHGHAGQRRDCRQVRTARCQRSGRGTDELRHRLDGSCWLAGGRGIRGADYVDRNRDRIWNGSADVTRGRQDLHVRLSCASGRGLAVGSAIKAGETIGYVGTPATSREPRLHFEVRHNGVPVDPIGDMQANTGTNSAVDQFVGRIINVESANKCTASNPLSTAVGLGQFIKSTWMTTIKLHRPDLMVGRSRQEVLALRTDCELSRAMTTAFTRDNAAVVRQAGHPVTPGNLYLAHFLGVGGAVKVLNSQPNLMISDVFGAAHVRANPFEQGKSIGFLVSWAAKKMAATLSGGNGSTSSQDSGGATSTANSNQPLAKFASDPVFAMLKTTVMALLQ